MLDLNNTYYEKTCRNCGESKGPEAYSRNSNTPDGLSSWCNACNQDLNVQRQAQRKEADPLYHEICKRKDTLKKVMRRWADGKTVTNENRISDDLGVPADVAKVLIEARMLPGMTWDNYGKGPGKRWEIDHVTPWATVRNWEQLEDVSDISNVHPMWKEQNRRKSSAGTKQRAHFAEVKTNG